MSHKDWFHWQWASGIDALSSFSDDHGPVWLASPFTERVSVLRTRLQVWAWWASNVYPQPGPAQVRYPLQAKIQFNGGMSTAEAEEPPVGWPADPGLDAEAYRHPTVYSTLELRAQVHRPADAGAMTPEVFYGWAELPSAAGDSAAQRRWDPANRLSLWLAIAQGTTDWGDSYPVTGGYIPFYFAARCQVLYEYDG